jgi:hypothetical protein
MSKPETIAQLKRKIERLEAKVQALEEVREKDFAGTRMWLSEAVDKSVRIKQAMQILLGEDDL